jgi:hypothetical protein
MAINFLILNFIKTILIKCEAKIIPHHQNRFLEAIGKIIPKFEPKKSDICATNLCPFAPLNLNDPIGHLRHFLFEKKYLFRLPEYKLCCPLLPTGRWK